MLLLLHEFAAESKEMDAATAKGNLDEGKVQEIAARQGTTVARFLVEKEHFKAKIYASVLNPEQRTKRMSCNRAGTSGWANYEPG